jgi:hypothetical protein
LPTAPSDVAGSIDPRGGLGSTRHRRRPGTELWPRLPLLGEWLLGRVVEPLAGRSLALWSVLHALMFAAGTLVVLMRLPADQQNVVWAEDGRVFLADALRDDLATNLFAPYAGYMHLFPRLAAQFTASAAPLEQLGLWINVCGAALWAGMALMAFVSTRGRLQEPLRWLLWVVVMIVPLGSLELATNVANSHWLLTFGLFTVLVSRSRGPVQIVFGSVVIALAVMSDPLTLLFAPFVLLRMLTLRNRRENIWSVVFIVSALVQVWAVLNTERSGATVVQPLSLGKNYFLRTVFGSLTGPSWGNEIFDALGAVVCVAIGIAVFAVVVAGIAARWRRTGLAAMAVLSSLGYFAVVGAMTWKQVVKQPLGFEVTAGGRYLVVGCLLFVFGVIALASVWIPERSSSTSPRRAALRATALVLLAAALLAPGIRDYQNPEYKAGSYEMTEVAEFVEGVCAEYPNRQRQQLEIAPSGWGMLVSCETILSH